MSWMCNVERWTACVVCLCLCVRTSEWVFSFSIFSVFFCFWGSQFYSRIIRNNSFSTLGVSCEALHIGALYLSLLHFIHTYFIHIRTTARLTRLAAMCMSSINGFCSTHICATLAYRAFSEYFGESKLRPTSVPDSLSLSLSTPHSPSYCTVIQQTAVATHDMIYIHRKSYYIFVVYANRSRFRNGFTLEMLRIFGLHFYVCQPFFVFFFLFVFVHVVVRCSLPRVVSVVVVFAVGCWMEIAVMIDNWMRIDDKR